LWKVKIIFVMSAHLFAGNSLALTGWIFIELCTG